MLRPARGSRLNEDVALSAVAGLAQVRWAGCCGASWENVVVVCNVYNVQTSTCSQVCRVQLQALDAGSQRCGLRGVEVGVEIVCCLNGSVAN